MLRGNHFVVGVLQASVIIWVDRNSSDWITSTWGLSDDMIKWLAIRNAFTFSYLNVRDKSFGPVKPPELPGLSHYLFNGYCDLVFGANVHNDPRWYSRTRITDGFASVPSHYIIPMPQASHTPRAIVRPFSSQVWLGLMVSLALVTLLLGWLLKRSVSFGRIKLRTCSNTNALSYAYQYVIGVLLNQGAFCFNAKLTIRLLAASWCLAAFVFTNAFNCLLTSFLATPDTRPLITYTEDLIESTDDNLRAIFVVGSGVEEIINGAKDGMYKNIFKKVQAYPKSRCTTMSECVQLVKSGNHVLLAGGFAGLISISDDFKATGKCNLATAKKKNSRTHMSTWTLRKDANDEQFEFFNRGIMEMKEYGLIAHWTKHYEPDARLCLDMGKQLLDGKRHESTRVTRRLTLSHLSGAFAALLAGYLASLVLFCLERFPRALFR